MCTTSSSRVDELMHFFHSMMRVNPEPSVMRIVPDLCPAVLDDHPSALRGVGAKAGNSQTFIRACEDKEGTERRGV